MITKENLVPVGRITKTHGINGEVVVVFSGDLPEWEDVRCIFLIMDGLPVPFFIESFRAKSSESDLLTLDGVDSEKEAALLCGKTVYISRDDLPQPELTDFNEGFYVDDLVGFSVSTDDGSLTGKITALDTSTANCLFIIQKDDGTEVLVPAVGEFIEDVDPSARMVTLSLPDGLLD